MEPIKISPPATFANEATSLASSCRFSCSSPVRYGPLLASSQLFSNLPISSSGWPARITEAADVTSNSSLAAAYRHRLSRVGDPQIHTHVLISQLVKAGEDGRWTSLYSPGLYREAKTAGFLYEAELRERLARSLELEWTGVTRGTAEIRGLRSRPGRCSLAAAPRSSRPKPSREQDRRSRSIEQILGISIADVEYLAGAIESGVLQVTITNIRNNRPYGLICEIPILVRGLGPKNDRVATVTTVWELAETETAPRLVNAYISD